MKRLSLSYVIATLALFGLGFMSGCGDDTETPAPTISLVTNPDKAVSNGTVVNFAVQVSAPEKIESVTILKKVGTTSTTVDGYPKTKDFQSSTNDLFVFSYTVVETSGDIEFTFKVTDKKGKEGSFTYTLNFSSSAADINTSTATLLGNQANSTDPSFYSTSTLTAYKIADAKTNSSKIDFAFGTGTASGNEFFIGSLKDVSIASVFADVTTWTTRNATTFKTTTLTAANFDGITSSTALAAAFDAGAAASEGTRVKASDTEVGDVFGFLTAGSKKGLVKVTARTSTSITIVVKVQK